MVGATTPRKITEGMGARIHNHIAPLCGLKLINPWEMDAPTT